MGGQPTIGAAYALLKGQQEAGGRFGARVGEEVVRAG